MQSKIEGLEQQLSSDSRDVAQRIPSNHGIIPIVAKSRIAISPPRVALIYLYKHRVLHQWYQTLQLLHFQAIRIQQ